MIRELRSTGAALAARPSRPRRLQGLLHRCNPFERVKMINRIKDYSAIACVPP